MARAGLTVERIARAGAELADDIGFDAVTVAQLARHFDVRSASMYSHLSGSADLRAQIALLALAEMADQAADAVAGKAGIDALRAIADSYRDYARAHPGRYAATTIPLDHATALRSAGPRHTRLLTAVLGGYHLTAVDETHAIRLFGSAVHGFIGLETAGSFAHSSPDAEHSWSRIIDALHATLTHWPSADELRETER